MSHLLEVGFTGTQLGMTHKQIERISQMVQDLYTIGARTIHLGDCIGADAQMYQIAGIIGYYRIGHPPTDPKKRAFLSYEEELPPLPYLERNHQIVDRCRILFAAPHTAREVTRSGTWTTVRYARRVHRTGTIITPNGSHRRLNESMEEQ